MKKILAILAASLLSAAVAEQPPQDAAAAGVASQEVSAAEAVANRFGRMYFAQMAAGKFWRLFDPEFGTVEFKLHDSVTFEGAAGWKAWRTSDGTIHVLPPEDGTHTEYCFVKGKPTVFKYCGRKYGVQVEDGEVTYSGTVPEMWDDDVTKEDDPLGNKWEERFTLIERNPNRFAVLVAALSLAALSGILFFPALRLFFGIGLAVFGTMMVLAASRGAEVGFAAGAAFIVIMWLWRKTGLVNTRANKYLPLALCGIVAVALAALFGMAKARGWFDDYGTVLRFEVWDGAMRMMADAPGGWGSMVASGDSFMCWYQAMEHQDWLFSLISAHLTHMVAFGWVGRFFWLFGWLGAIAVLARHAFKGGSPLPCALWLSLFIAAIFNPVLSSYLLTAPTNLALVWWAWKAKPWKDLKGLAVPLATAAVATLAILFWINHAGHRARKPGELEIHRVGNAVYVNGAAPKIWIVDDGKRLGWHMCAKGIRHYLLSRPNLPAVAYVTELKDLPPKMERVIISGERCREYIEAWRNGKAPKAEHVIFMSPTFGPSEVPDGLRAQSSFLMVIGEFAARFTDVYGEGPYPDWVGIALGAEAYIPGWMSFTTTK